LRSKGKFFCIYKMPLRYKPRYGARTKLRRRYRKKVLWRKPLATIVKSSLRRNTRTNVKPIKANWADLEAASQRIVQLSEISVGSASDERVGDVIMPLRIKGKVAVKCTAATDPVVVRCMLIKARQCDGTAPTLADILPDANSSLTYLATDQPFLDDTGNGYGLAQSRRKFQILFDRTVTMSYATADSANVMKFFYLNKKLSGKTYYTNSAATDEGNNQYYLFVHTDAGDDKIEEQHDIRFFFKNT